MLCSVWSTSFASGRLDAAVATGDGKDDCALQENHSVSSVGSKTRSLSVLSICVFVEGDGSAVSVDADGCSMG